MRDVSARAGEVLPKPGRTCICCLNFQDAVDAFQQCKREDNIDDAEMSAIEILYEYAEPDPCHCSD